VRIVFFGTPVFSVPSLQALHEAAHFEVVAVVTVPDKPAGRGRKPKESDVKKYALKAGIPILQPYKLRDKDFLNKLYALQADVFVVIAFRMLPEVVWNHPPMGTINLHASYLPDYRGAAPINWAIINGENYTGLSTFRLKHAIDTGNLLLRQRVEIHQEETAGSLHDKLSEMGAILMLKTLEGIQNGKLEEQVQNEKEFVHQAPKLTKDHMHIDWNKSAQEIESLIRGLSPYPGAFSFFETKLLKIFKVRISDDCRGVAPSRIQTDKKNTFKIATADYWIELIEIQPEGKKRMNTKNWLMGLRSWPEHMG
jgi:methionyl-tRNA formyltransferase